MKKMDGICTAVVLCAVLMLFLWSLYEERYPIELDTGNTSVLADYVNEMLEQKEIAPENQAKVRKVFDAVDLDKSKIVLIEVGSPVMQPRLGMVVLEKGINGQYRIGWISHGTSNIQDEVVEEGTNTYFLIAGRNPNRAIRKIVLEQRGAKEDVTVEIPEKEQFLVAVLLQPGWNYAVANWRFYNAAGEDITSEVEW